MSIFQDSKQFYETVGELMDRAKVDPVVGPKIAKSGIIIQFRYTEPDAITTINAKDKPTQKGAYCDVIHGETGLKPDITMSMKADISHSFWSKKIDLLGAIAKKQITVQGSLPKVLQLLPTIEPLYKQYPALLKEKGLGHMVLK